MNRVEKIVYDLLKGNPKIKLTIRNIYQSLFDLLPNKKNFSINKIIVKEGYFFGFHDHTPFSIDDKKILANKITIPLRMPKSSDLLEVGYFINNNEIENFIKLGETTAWNYHKGCRLQWLNEHEVIFNDIKNERICACIINTLSKEKKWLLHPIDSSSKSGKFATSFSYQRLEKLMPGYGYNCIDEAFLDENTSENTGLFEISIDTNKRKVICSLAQLSKLGKLDKESFECKHFVTHSLYSNDGRYIAFLHRWIKDDVRKRWSRLIVYDKLLNEYYLSPTNGMVSHYVWNEKNQIIAYCRIDNIDSHVLFEEPTLKKFKRVAYPQLNSDGHQCFVTNNSFITDTYPDKYRMAKLYKVDIDKNEVECIAHLNSLKKYQTRNTYKHWACDFHPRMSNNNSFVCFDSVHTNERALCFMKM